MILLCCRAEYDTTLLEHAFSLCPAWRQQKASGLKNEKSRALSITAGLLLRHALHLFGSGDCEAVIGKNGKPALKQGGAFFSLSHSGDFAACAVSERPVGVDIQTITDISERVMRRFCTESELNNILQSENPRHRAIEIWSLKESYLKAAEKSTEEVFKTALCFDRSKGVLDANGFSFYLSSEIPGYVVTACEKLRYDAIRSQSTSL